MAGPGTAMGISLTTITTDAQCPLGFIHTEPATNDTHGEKQWIYVQVTSGTTAGGLPVGTAVVKHTGSQSYNDVESADGADDPGRCVGVAQQLFDYAAFTPVATELFGFVLRTGDGVALDGPGAATVDHALMTTAGGTLDDTTTAITDASVGICTTVAAAGLIQVLLYCKG